MMCWPIISNKACSIKHETHWKILYSNIVDDLIITTLQKR